MPQFTSVDEVSVHKKQFIQNVRDYLIRPNGNLNDDNFSKVRNI